MIDDDTMLTTLDNPYDPFTEFKEWYAYDIKHGYNTCGLIDRVSLTSSELSDEETDFSIGQAYEEILKLNVTGNYVLVKRKQTNEES